MRGKFLDVLLVGRGFWWDGVFYRLEAEVQKGNQTILRWDVD
jgi:hypothetical protein